MTVQDIVNELKLTVVTCEAMMQRKVTSGCVGDLLSVIMGKAEEDCVWVTVQSHINIIAVASLINVSCIIVSEGYNLDADAVAKAIEEDVIVLQSTDSSFEICGKLAKLGV